MKKELQVISYEDAMGAIRCICVRGTIEEAMIDSSAKAPKKDEDVSPIFIKKGTRHATTRDERRVQKAAHKRRDRSHKEAHWRHVERLAYGRGMAYGTDTDDIRNRRMVEAETNARNDDTDIMDDVPKLIYDPVVINGMKFRNYIDETMYLPTIGEKFGFGTQITVYKK